jgi:hypothetical protein
MCSGGKPSAHGGFLDFAGDRKVTSDFGHLPKILLNISEHLSLHLADFVSN